MALLTALPLQDLAGALSLALAVFITTYITSLCFTPPNSNPRISKGTDRTSFAIRLIFFYYGSAIIQLIGIYHALLCFTYPAPPLIICPRPSNLSPLLFTWNPHTIICVALILLAGQILLLCFTQLGPNFTFQLMTPKKLITTGPYRWVQHPCYAANVIIFLANGAIFQRRDGVAACWLPESIVKGGKFGTVLWIGYLCIVIVGCSALTQRVKKEEAMLKRTFGKEWEDYHQKTKRFIPGVI